MYVSVYLRVAYALAQSFSFCIPESLIYVYEELLKLRRYSPPNINTGAPSHTSTPTHKLIARLIAIFLYYALV